MKVLSEEKALELTEKLLGNDKDIKEILEDKIDDTIANSKKSIKEDIEDGIVTNSLNVSDGMLKVSDDVISIGTNNTVSEPIYIGSGLSPTTIMGKDINIMTGTPSSSIDVETSSPSSPISLKTSFDYSGISIITGGEGEYVRNSPIIIKTDGRSPDAKIDIIAGDSTNTSCPLNIEGGYINLNAKYPSNSYGITMNAIGSTSTPISITGGRVNINTSSGGDGIYIGTATSTPITIGQATSSRPINCLAGKFYACASSVSFLDINSAYATIKNINTGGVVNLESTGTSGVINIKQGTNGFIRIGTSNPGYISIGKSGTSSSSGSTLNIASSSLNLVSSGLNFSATNGNVAFNTNGGSFRMYTPGVNITASSGFYSIASPSGSDTININASSGNVVVGHNNISSGYTNIRGGTVNINSSSGNTSPINIGQQTKASINPININGKVTIQGAPYNATIINTSDNGISIGKDNTPVTSRPVYFIGTHLKNGTSEPGAYYEGTVVLGGYNNQTTTFTDNLLIVGNGLSAGDAANGNNALRLTTNGYLYYGTGCGEGADYAEFYEWSDGNPDNEDRCGVFVTYDLDAEWEYKNSQELPPIRIAQAGDYILGVISGNPAFVGNSDEDWKQRWLYDDFDRPIVELIEVPVTEMREIETGEFRTEIEYDENDNEIEVQIPITKFEEVETGEYRTQYVQVQNPNYDPSQVYKSRFDRPEWSTAGMLGNLSVKDDGTCEVGKFCKCGKDGIATIADERDFDTFYVTRRISDNIIKIVYK